MLEMQASLDCAFASVDIQPMEAQMKKCIVFLLSLFVLLIPAVAFAADTPTYADPVRDALSQYTQVAVAALISGMLALGTKVWRWFTGKTKIDQTKLGRELAELARDRAEQLFRSGKIQGNQRMKYALDWFRTLATQKKIPKVVVDQAEDWIEAVIGAAKRTGAISGKLLSLPHSHDTTRHDPT